MDITKIINRIKILKGVGNDQDVAKLLNISKHNLSNYKVKGGVPVKNLVAFCLKNQVSIDWLLTGETKSSGESYAPKETSIEPDDILDFTDYRSELQRKDDRNQKEKVVWTEAFGFLSYILQSGGIDEIEFIHYSLRNMVRLIKKRDTGE